MRMPTQSSSRVPRFRLRCILFILTMAVCIGGSPVFAGEPAAPEPVIATEIPPTEVPPLPTTIPTEEPPPPTAVPTDIPTAIPSTEIPPTVEPTTLPTETATVEPTATAVPDPCDLPGVGRVSPLVQTTSTGFGEADSNGVSYPALTNAFTITISLPSPDACLVRNWSVTMVAGPMSAPEGGWIPASAITFAGIAVGPPAPVPVGTSLASPQVIVRGTDDTLAANDGILSIRVLVELSPPADTPPGAYRGEIAVDAVVVP